MLTASWIVSCYYVVCILESFNVKHQHNKISFARYVSSLGKFHSVLGGGSILHMNLLVTGSTGLVGSRVVALGEQKIWAVKSVTRQSSNTIGSDIFCINSLDGQTDWSGAFEGVDCVVHCAARVHQMRESESTALEAYRKVNTEGTLNLAKQAACAGVKRFVFISSIKVNGEFSKKGYPFSSVVNKPPTDPYGLSKYEAELGLAKLSAETGLEVVIIRPPLVYGPGVQANFLSMMRWTRKQLPLPLGSIDNKRSLVYVDNLADLILKCCENPSAVGKVLLVSDDHDISTTELLKCVAKHMDKESYLIPIPSRWIKTVSKLLGKAGVGQRLCSSLQVDITETKRELNWTPPIGFDQGVKETVSAFLDIK